MHVIDLVPGDAYRRDSYGVILQSKFTHSISGRGVHNPSFQHSLDVWINADGRDPRGNPTEQDLSYLFSAQASVISAAKFERPERGPTLAIGDTVVLRIGRREIGKFTIVAGRLSDPHLERI